MLLRVVLLHDAGPTHVRCIPESTRPEEQSAHIRLLLALGRRDAAPVGGHEAGVLQENVWLRHYGRL